MSQSETKALAAVDFLNFVPAMFAMQKEFLHTVESDHRRLAGRSFVFQMLRRLRSRVPSERSRRRA